MRANNISSLLQAGKTIINGWLSIGSAYVAEIIANQDFDSVTVDCQHGMIGFDTCLAMLQAISTTRATPLVRPSCGDPAQIMRFLDAGAYGIICPMISTAEQARQLVEACRFPPVGNRSYGPARGILYGGGDYFRSANTHITVLAMIETAEGLRNVEQIADVPGLDGIYVGPNDLGVALGYDPVPESAEQVVIDAVEMIRKAVVSRNKVAGIFCSEGFAAAGRLSQGFNMVTPGNDAALLAASIRKQVVASRRPDRIG